MYVLILTTAAAAAFTVVVTFMAGRHRAWRGAVDDCWPGNHSQVSLTCHIIRFK
jgi:hypothetical protein